MNFSDAPFAASKTALLNVLQSVKAPAMGLSAKPEDYRALKAYHAELIAMLEETIRHDLSEAKARAPMQPHMCGLDEDFLMSGARAPFGLFEQLDDLASDREGDALGFGRAA